MIPPQISLIGMGADGVGGLAPPARRALERAGVIIASRRLLALIDDAAGLEAETRLSWPSPFNAMIERLYDYPDQEIAILATGDPMWYGVGAVLFEKLSPHWITVYPAPSAFSLAAARMGWPLHQVTTLSVHGRPLAGLIPYLQPGARLLILTSGGDDPARIVDLLRRTGYASSAVTVLENLAGEHERHIIISAETVAGKRFSPLNTVAVECRADAATRPLPRLAGLPDDAFIHDGLLTKREVRAATLAALCPLPGQLLWDIGAGCGSIAIEWLRAEPSAHAIAFERNHERIAMIEQNRDRLGAPGLEVVAGVAPDCLTDRQPPDAVFIGGGVADGDILDAAWRALDSGGRMVANVVTLEGRARLIDWRAANGGDLIEIAISRAGELGAGTVMKPALPVLQYRGSKP